MDATATLRRTGPSTASDKMQYVAYDICALIRAALYTAAAQPDAAFGHTPPYCSSASSPAAHEVTGLLMAWSEGDETAFKKLVPLIYSELHRLAHRYMVYERLDHPLQTTALVHEAYLRLVEAKVRWRNRAQFFGISARVMRRILHHRCI